MRQVVLPVCVPESKDRQNGGKNNISNEKFDFVLSTNFQLLWQIKGRAINYSFFNVHSAFCYGRLLTLLAPGAKTPSYATHLWGKFACDLFKLSLNVICSKLFGKQNFKFDCVSSIYEFVFSENILATFIL